MVIKQIEMLTHEEKKFDYLETLAEELRMNGFPVEVEDNEIVIRWRDPKVELPELLPDCDYSNNVLAQVEGFTETQVMCLLFVPDDEGGWGYVWANCYGDINGEAEWDDDYKVIGWRPIE